MLKKESYCEKQTAQLIIAIIINLP